MVIAPPVLHIKERKIVEAFERAGATDPGRARTTQEAGVETSGFAWRRLRARGLVRDAGGGRFFVDVPLWEARRRRNIMIALLLVLTILVAALLAQLGRGVAPGR